MQLEQLPYGNIDSLHRMCSVHLPRLKHILDTIQIPHILDNDTMIHGWLKNIESISLTLQGPTWRFSNNVLDAMLDNFGKYCGNISEYIAKLLGDTMLAFTMSAHERLGSQSLAHGINPDVMPIIYKYLY